jgi:18S rRNA (guanine1575-N7)-methyltransferase
MSRPEYTAPPEVFYDEKEAKKYTSNSRIIEIQGRMSERALELLALPPDEPKYILDIGCGSGLSGDVIEEHGHLWVGVDISPSMLDVAVERGVDDGDICQMDMGHGLPFRPGSFDGAISISALQWLCNQDKTSHVPQRRMKKFFSSLYNCLSRGARAVFQFYPDSPDQVQLLTAAAMRSGFTGGLVVDFPNSTKAKKYFLVLFAGSSIGQAQLPQGLNDEPRNTVAYDSRNEARERARARKGGKNPDKPKFKSRDWILKKKERQRKQGKDVREDTRYSGRKRPGAF